MDEKSLSPLFLVGGGQWLQMTGALLCQYSERNYVQEGNLPTLDL